MGSLKNGPVEVTVDNNATSSNSIGNEDQVVSNDEGGAHGSAEIEEEDSHSVSAHWNG